LSDLYDEHLVNDRIEFKIYSCKKLLESLKKTKLIYENFQANNQDISQARTNLEIEIDCLISQMISVIDCLLIQISNKLGLSIPLHQISIDRVVSELYSKTKKIDLLTELDMAREHGKWYWSVVELRNHSLVEPFDVNTRNPDLISFLEECFNHVRVLIENIKNKEPLGID
jgi:hypothetical protein